MPLNYDLMIQEALLSVIKKSLKEVEKNGLTEQHHFYITFATAEEGVIMPKSLKDKYPEEITIVLQYQFWNLKVGENEFSVNLSFNSKTEYLSVPYKAIISFMDPSVRFGLQFSFKGDDETPDEKEQKEYKAKMPLVDNVVSLSDFKKNNT